MPALTELRCRRRTEITVNSKGHPGLEAQVVRLCLRLGHKNIVTVRIENYRPAGIGQVVSRCLREVIRVLVPNEEKLRVLD